MKEEIAQLIAQMIQNGIIVTSFYKEEEISNPCLCS